MQIIQYEKQFKSDWDAFAQASCNGTFLFNRNYMDYHKNRFQDCSLLFFNKNKLAGIFPANIDKQEIYSHSGLTYGGLVWNKRTTSFEVKEMLEKAITYYKEKNIQRLYYKPLPYIYHQYPASEDLYFLFTKKAELIHRSLSSTILISTPKEYSTLRRRHLKLAEKNALTISYEETDIEWNSFWELLTTILKDRHQQRPVHNLSEIKLLKSHFPKEIRLVTVEKEKRVIAGCLAFLTPQVLHIQYISSDDEGCKTGALEFLFYKILSSELCYGRNYLDFGISTEQNGNILNEGLLFQKEGLGGRGICYDEYCLNL